MKRPTQECVRCGEEFPTYEDGATYLRPLQTTVDQYGEHGAAADRERPKGYLCPDCADDFVRFMDGGEP